MKPLVALGLFLILPACAQHPPRESEPPSSRRAPEEDLLPGLAARLKESRANPTIHPAVIDPDPAVPAERVVAAVDAAREAGFAWIGFAAPREPLAEPRPPEAGLPRELPFSRTCTPVRRGASGAAGWIAVDRRTPWATMAREIERRAVAGIAEVSFAVRAADGGVCELTVPLRRAGCEPDPEGESPRVLLLRGDGPAAWKVEVETSGPLYFPVDEE